MVFHSSRKCEKCKIGKIGWYWSVNLYYSALNIRLQILEICHIYWVFVSHYIQLFLRLFGFHCVYFITKSASMPFEVFLFLRFDSILLFTFLKF